MSLPCSFTKKEYQLLSKYVHFPGNFPSLTEYYCTEPAEYLQPCQKIFDMALNTSLQDLLQKILLMIQPEGKNNYNSIYCIPQNTNWLEGGGSKNRGIPRTPKNIQYGELKQPFILRWLRSSHPDVFLEKGVLKICSKIFFLLELYP